VKAITVYCTWGWRSMSCDSWRLALHTVFVFVFKQFHMVQRGLNIAGDYMRPSQWEPFTWWRLRD